MKPLLGFLTAILLSACAPALFHADFQADSAEKDATAKFPSTVSATENGKTVEVPKAIRNFYLQNLQEFVPDGCTIDLSFDGNVEERYASPWYLGIFLLAPFWPAMPREDDIRVTAECSLRCDGTVVERVWILEEEHPRLFWYGPYRNGYIQEKADWVHVKLVARLKQALSPKTPAADSIPFDIY